MAVWLYVSGVPTYFVTVSYPFVPVVVYAGRNFYWTGTRYEATYVPVPFPVQAAPQEMKALGTSPVIMPSTIPEMRTYLLDGIQRMQDHPYILGLTEVDKAILQAEYRLYSTDDSAVSKVLSTLQAMFPVSVS